MNDQTPQPNSTPIQPATPPAPVENDEVKALKAKADEMRANNIALAKKIAEYEAKFSGIDPEEVKQIKTQREQAKSAEVLEIERRYKAELEKEKGARSELQRTLDERTLQGELMRQASALGVKESAIEDFIARGSRAFRVADGKVISAKEDGLTVLEWATELRKKADHLFGPSIGGGARGSGTAGSTGRIQMTREQARFPTKEQQIAIAKGLVDFI